MSVPDNLASKAPVFIVGCPRSGTTLLQRLLAAHSGVAIAPETHFMRQFWLHRQGFGNLDDDANFRRLLAAVTATPEFADLHIDAETWTQTAWQGERSYGALLWLLLEQYARANDASFVGEKTPNHVFFLADLHGLFPEARFVHLVRDPRAVVNSWRHCPWTSGSAWRDAVRWRRHVRAAMSAKVPGMITVFYEKLVQQPGLCLQNLCRFLDLTFEPDMLLYHQRASTAFDMQREPWKARALSPIASELATSWQNELSPAAIAAVEAVAWREMKFFGYHPVTSKWRLLSLFPYFRLRMAADRVRRAVMARTQPTPAIAGPA